MPFSQFTIHNSQFTIKYVSAKTGAGIDELKEFLYNTVIDKKTLSEGVIVSNARHFDALNAALKNIRAAKKNLETQSTAELVASDIRSAIKHIGEITGEITTDDILGNIFGRFCIGK